MESERYQRVERLFHDALALAPAERDQFISLSAAGDNDLARRVRRMIDFASRESATAGFISNGDAGDHADDADHQRLMGQTVGRYRIIERIGEGGFGSVYRAEQQHPVRREVALKILRSGMDSRRVIARFDAERQTLAVMEHPNIARVFDAGQTDPELGSRPYFVMELVSGEPINAYCDRRRMDARQRLELFITVCSAVQHAHQKGVIHRDLKPSNILVGDEAIETGDRSAPRPIVIDFGIAKAIHSDSGNPAMTQRLEMLGTPQYMSPEQAEPEGRGIDTRSDIYSLGVVLYELLTGGTPLDSKTLQTAAPSQIPRLIRERTPEKPSARITRSGEAGRDIAHNQGTEVSTLKRRLKGDLDWITLKALEVDRERRYASAAAFADDIRRHLNHEPVLAGPPTAAYRTRKFVRRHRMAVAAAAAIAVVVIGGIVGVTLAMMEARRAADQAVKVSAFLADVLTSANPDRSGTEVRLVDVLRNATNTVSERFAGYPELEANVRETLGFTFLKLALPRESSEQYRQAVELLRNERGADDLRVLFVQTLHVRSLMNEGAGGAAERVLNDALPRIERVAGRGSSLWEEAMRMQAGVYRLRGRLDEAESLLNSLRSEMDASPAGDSAQLTVLQELIRVHKAQLTGNREQQRPTLQRIEAVATELGERATRRFGAESEGAIYAQAVVAFAKCRLGHPREALKIITALVPVARSRVGECHSLHLELIGTQADALNSIGDPGAAADLAFRELQCLRDREGTSVGWLARANDLQVLLDRAGRADDAERLAREYLSVLQTFGGGHGDLKFIADLWLARSLTSQGRLDEAQPMLEALEGRVESEGADSLAHARLHASFAACLRRRGLFEEAQQRLLAATALLGDKRAGTLEVAPEDVLTEYVALYEAWGKPERAAEYAALRDEVLRHFAGDG